MRDEDGLATILLVGHIARDGVTPLTASKFWALCERFGRPSTLLGRTMDDLIRSGLPTDIAEQVCRLLGRATSMAFELERLEQSGISTLTPFDEHYPDRLRNQLGTNAPAVLHAAGSLELLDEAGVGVVGSRNVGPDGREVALDLGRQARSLGLPVVSGAARGVDQLAMGAAFEAGGSVIGIPAHSLLRTLRSSDVRRAIYDGRTVFFTPYAPDAPFSVWRAMGRNRLIYALSKVTVVVAADDGTGGSWGGAVESLKGKFGTVAVWRGDGEGPGNEHLESMGALRIAAVEELDELIETDLGADRPIGSLPNQDPLPGL